MGENNLVTAKEAIDGLAIHILQCTIAQLNGSQSIREESQLSELLESNPRARRIYLEQMLDAALLVLISRETDNDCEAIL